MAASRLEFSILGPLTVFVDGMPIPVGGPKQRALLALLLLSANRVVPRERLIEEVFPDQSVRSADHALRNHVSRLRKLLADGEPRLVARAPGYLLRVEPGELDLERFEQLVVAARAAGDAAAAAPLLREAEQLWHGRPLADLELEQYARIEVERLEELKLAAVEERIEAELALGSHRTLVPELEALGAEYPYRERFRAQLMLALYRCGRQTEGLAVYRQTRTLLSDELGLEPGVELQELERAILVHDPSLAPATEDSAPQAAPLLDVCPFKGLAPFDAADGELFFGRERLVDELRARLWDSQLLLLVGASGSGKTSLLRAGLLPELPGEHVVLRPSEHRPLERGGQRVVAVDQLEELFASSVGEDERRAFIDSLVDAAWDPERRTLILVALRADFFGHLAPYVELADLVAANHVLLPPMSARELRRTIEGPAERVGLEVEPALVDALVDDVVGEPGGLPLLSTVLLDLWRERDGHSLTLAAYERTGGVRGAVGRHAETAIGSLDEDEREIARRILVRLADGGDGDALTRRRVSRNELDADADPRIARVLAELVERRLLVADDGTVELVHEALLDQWPRLTAWLEEDAHGRRLHRHLTLAAAEWDASGRDPGGLYRGARLAAALGWADTAGEHAGLNTLERTFLGESRAAFARANRRLRTLLALAVVLLVAALAAGAIALAARGSATRHATAATAQRLGAQALVEPTLDRSLLLARTGVDLDDSVATRSNLLAALMRSPAALAVLHAGGTRPIDDALSPDGRTLAVRGDDGSVSFFDTRTLRPSGPPFRGSAQISYFGAVVRPKRALAFSPDGRTLAVGDTNGNATLVLVDAHTRRVVGSVESPARAVTSDVVFAPGGRVLVTGEAVSGRFVPAAEVLVRRRASDGRALARSKPFPDGRLVGFTEDGRRLFETSAKASYLVDARTLARVRTFPTTGVAVLSPDGREVAIGRDDGSVGLLDLRTGSLRPLVRRAASPVLALAFAARGRVLATASDDGSVDVWDVATRTLRETFAGHAASAFGLLFSPRGSTLYSGSNDGRIIVWDVRGERRLGRPFRFSPTPEGGQGAHTPPPRGATAALAISPDGHLFATVPAPNRVTLWNLRDRRVVGELRGRCRDVVSLAFSHDGQFLAAVCDVSRTVVWRLGTSKPVRYIGPERQPPMIDVGFSPDDRLLATADDDGELRVYDFRSGRTVARVHVKGSLQGLAFSPDGARLAAGGLSGDVAIWSLARKRLERTIKVPDIVQSLQFSPDSKEIATGELSGNVQFWDPSTGRRVGPTLSGQNGDVLGVAFAPDGTELVTTSGDGKLRIWDLASGKTVGAPLPGADTGGWATFTPDGKHVIAAFWSGTGVDWNVDPASWKRQACRIAHRNLTRAEWQNFLPGRRYRAVCP